VEHLQVIHLADAQAELSGVLVEVDGALLGAVDAAEINGELAIDEDPDVVVTAEREDLAALITEGDDGFAGEVPVVRRAIELKTFIAKAEGRINGVEIGVVVNEGGAVAGEG
jgi:hypothetical protein